MTYTYTPRNVCSQQMRIELDGTIIKDVQILGGCNGNLQGISRLVVGRDAREVIKTLEGIHCGPRPTSCPDQLSIALKKALEQAG
ncbi:MAG: TIGR03905 family TSCPD domain-containing protein [Oscillospiraceae bacterium]|nr:TIGR03905 family TSCPD domain-containing protein [Oscillospiraceae bacterium]